MKKRMLIIALTGLCFVTAMALCENTHAYIERLSQEDLVASASRIVVGKVIYVESKPDPDDTIIFTHITLSVFEHIKGDSKEREITFLVPGGTIADTTVWVEHAATFMVGENVLVYLRPGPWEKLFVNGGYQGKVALRPGSADQVMKKAAGLMKKIRHIMEGKLEDGEGDKTSPYSRKTLMSAWQNISITPSSQSAGTDSSITIYPVNGGDFSGDASASNDSLLFKGETDPFVLPRSCPYVTWSNDSIEVELPRGYGSSKGLSSGPVTVVVDGVHSDTDDLEVTFSYLRKKWPDGDLPNLDYHTNPL